MQINESYSRPGTLRGLHFQWNPQMGKLVRTVAGRMVDFALDIRKGSPFFGHVIAYDMPSTAEQSYGEWIWVPPGFAHGNFFPQRTRIEYLCSGQWSPGCEAGISPLAADLDWSLCDGKCKALLDGAAAAALLISDKDRAGLTLAAMARRSPRGEFSLRPGVGSGGPLMRPPRMRTPRRESPARRCAFKGYAARRR